MPQRGFQGRSHCRGHRFESGMLHSKSCISMQEFLFSCANLKEFCCKTCKNGTPFRDVPQFIPQLMPANPGKSKKSVHFCDLFLLGFHAGMGIKLECQGYLRMPQNLRESADVHPVKAEPVTLRLRNDYVDEVLDKFGFAIQLIPDGTSWFKTTVTVEPTPEFFGWVFSLGNWIEIIGPASIRARMRSQAWWTEYHHRNKNKRK